MGTGNGELIVTVLTVGGIRNYVEFTFKGKFTVGTDKVVFMEFFTKSIDVISCYLLVAEIAGL